MLKPPDPNSSSDSPAKTNGALDLSDLDALDVPEREHWQEGPPHAIFKELRARCPVHWSEIPEYPNEDGFWSLTRAEHVREVSLDWETYSSERGGVTDIFLPKWFAHSIPAIHAPLLVLMTYLHARNLRRAHHARASGAAARWSPARTAVPNT